MWLSNVKLTAWRVLFADRQAGRPVEGRGLHDARQNRARVEHAFARMKTWKILLDCRLKGDGVHHAMRGIARLHNLTLDG